MRVSQPSPCVCLWSQALDPLVFPSGGVFFETEEVQRAGVQPVIVHNNFIFGVQQKIRRFKERGLW